MDALRRLWRFLQELSGDSEYERYCAEVRARNPGRPLPTAREYYQARMEEKYSRLSRCC